MRKHGMTGRAARACAAHPWRTFTTWLVLLALAGGMAGTLGDALTNEDEVTTYVESARADELLAELRPEGLMEHVVVESDLAVTDAAVRDVAAVLADDLRRLRQVRGVVGFVDDVPGTVSPDGHSGLLIVSLIGTEADAAETVEPVLAVLERYDARPDLRVTSIGHGSIHEQFMELADETLARAEAVSLPIALVILVLVFGAVVAAGLPLVLGFVGIVGALGLTALIGQAMDLSTFVVNMVTMIGLAVGIDYSLFIVQRFREERAKGRTVVDAVGAAGDTASRAVLFSGMTVVIALTGMLYIPFNVMQSLGVGAITAVVASVAAAMTLLPALLGLLGDRVDRLRVRRRPTVPGGGRFWHRMTEIVMRRRWIAALGTAAVLVLAATPYLSINTGSNYIGSLPEDSPSVHAFEVLNADFSKGAITTPVVVEADDITAPEVQRTLMRLRARIGARAEYGEVTTTQSEDLDLAVVDAVTKIDPATDEARDEVRRLREEDVRPLFADLGGGARAYVGGDAASIADIVDVLNDRTPTIFAFVLGLSFVLLMIVFRSIVVPLKAIVMNLLSVGAAYGLLVLVFQEGWGADLLSFRQTDVIESWVPLFLFTVLFGLSMDYHLFLLSRVKEHHDHGFDTRASVAWGLGSTGSIITGAALIMVAVFGGFAAGELVMFEQVGFGLAVAVILDATLVRTVLVPSTMALLDEANWYLPSWLEWLPRVRLETSEPAPEPDDHGVAA